VRRERAGEVDGEGALAHAALAGGDRDGVFDLLRRASGAGEVAAGRSHTTARRGFGRGDGNLHDRLGDTRDGAQDLLDLLLELERGLRVARGEGQRDLHRAVDEARGPHQAERHDVAAEAGILHLLEMLFDLVRSHR
jgi:hypothetical protein